MLTNEWRKASASQAKGDCVEARLGAETAVAVRDSQNPDKGAVALSPAAWVALIAASDDL